MIDDLLSYSARIALTEKDAEIARLTATLTEARRLLTVALGYLEGVRAEEPYQPAWLGFATAMAVLRDFVLVEEGNDEQ